MGGVAATRVTCAISEGLALRPNDRDPEGSPGEAAMRAPREARDRARSVQRRGEAEGTDNHSETCSRYGCNQQMQRTGEWRRHTCLLFSFFFFLSTVLAAFRSSQTRDQTHPTAVTQPAAVKTPEP